MNQASALPNRDRPLRSARAVHYSLWIALLLLSAGPLLLMSALPVADPQPADDPVGLTLSEAGASTRLIVTSVRTGGPAEHGGVQAGDLLRAIDGRGAAGRKVAEHIFDEARSCHMRLDLVRGGAPLVAMLNRCGGGDAKGDWAKHGKDTGRRG
jgi:hypothetical protein